MFYFSVTVYLSCSKKLRSFKEGKTQVLIATDAMTRGMDVEGIRNVINYDVPTYIKTFIHRAGRTARAGQLGRCFTLLRQNEVMKSNFVWLILGINCVSFFLKHTFIWNLGEKIGCLHVCLLASIPIQFRST